MHFVINVCYGGFHLSKECTDYIKEKYGIELDDLYDHRNDLKYRSDPRLLDAIDTLGLEKCSHSDCTSLEVIEVPDYYSIDELEIHEYDGIENLQTIPVRFY